MLRTFMLSAALAAPLAAEAATFGAEPIIWSHRGSSYLARENTLEAFELSAQHGADGFELDLFLTRDGQLAVFHDPDLNRLTNVETAGGPFTPDRARDTDGDGVNDTWFVADFDMAELRLLEIDADSRTGRVALQADPRNPVAQPAAYRIPTYEEALDLAERLGQKVLTEVKLTDATSEAERAAVQDRLIAIWTDRGYDDASSPVVVQAFSDAFMAEIDAKLEATPLHVPTVQLNFDAASREALAVFFAGGGFDPSLLVPTQDELTRIIGERYGMLDGIAVTLDVLLPDGANTPFLNPFGLDFMAAAEANGLDIYGYTFRIDQPAGDDEAAAAAIFDSYLAALAAGDFGDFLDPYLTLSSLDGFITDNPDIALAARATLTPIPLPAAGWLLGAGLLALAGLRRR